MITIFKKRKEKRDKKDKREKIVAILIMNDATFIQIFLLITIFKKRKEKWDKKDKKRKDHQHGLFKLLRVLSIFFAFIFHFTLSFSYYYFDFVIPTLEKMITFIFGLSSLH